jgi:hypothetical protein
MTAQASDIVVFQGSEHVLAGICGEGLFEPEAHGFTPIGKDTGCWRGHVCTYGVKGDQFVLQGLLINHGRWNEGTYVSLPAPPFDGRAADEKEEGYSRFDLQYSKVDLPVAFSGGLLVAKDFIREMYAHMGFHPAWKYRTVHELVFERGRLTSQNDVSSQLHTYRERFENRNAPPSSEELERIDTWIAETFSLRYGGA